MKSHIENLEAEAIYIIREALAESKNPVMLYSLGKDSSVMLHIAKKAFSPGNLPFPLLHVDTKWKFKEMYDFRDKVALEDGIDLKVFTNQGIEENINPFDHGSEVHTDIMKTQALKMALNEYKFDLAFGGARRMKKNLGQKKEFFLSGTNLMRGIQKTKDQNYGIILILEKKKGSL